jgi:ABC-type transport system involved in cytochrome c biogenesis permease subunit
MFSYALLGASALIAVYGLVKKNYQLSAINSQLDNLVQVGLAFMTFGMLFGALWAKEAWGHYWSWDPKETWAAITWIAYLVYIHYRLMSKAKSQQPGAKRLAFWMLITSFVLLQMCWWGINYLPSAQGSSVHTYSTSE